MYEITEYLYMQCVNAVVAAKLVPSYLSFTKAVITSIHDAFLISSEELPSVSVIQIIYLYCGKIGDSIINAYKQNPTAINLKNFEELLKVYNLLILYSSDKFTDLSGFAVSGFINSLTDQDDACFKL